ncbi:MAG: hemolysin III family protein [Anaerolineales bacterium]|jgi:hemolysin III
MTKSDNIPGNYYGRIEERLNGLTHGLGAVFSVVGLVVLITRAVKTGDVWYIVSFSIYGVSLVSMYLSSTLYHSIGDPAWKVILQKLDHSAIFLLIAGTYTPFLLVKLRGALGWSLFGIVWGITLIGLVLKFWMISRWKGLSVGLYLGMGWLAMFAGKELVQQLDSASLTLLVIGGACYTIGVVFYLWRRLPYNHAIWHLFVLGGSATHYFSVLYMV